MVSENPINTGVCDSLVDKRSFALGTAPTFSPDAFPRKIRKFHGMEVPDFLPQRTQGSRAATKSSDPFNAKGARGAKDANADPNSRFLAKDAENAKELSLGGAAGGS
jgi:hypothetical protein